MLDGAFKQEASNIIEDTFSACDAWKSRMFEEINNYTACALGSEKYIKRRPRFSSTRIFVNGFWQFDPKPPNCMLDKAISKIDKYLKG